MVILLASLAWIGGYGMRCAHERVHLCRRCRFYFAWRERLAREHGIPRIPER